MSVIIFSFVISHENSQQNFMCTVYVNYAVMPVIDYSSNNICVIICCSMMFISVVLMLFWIFDRIHRFSCHVIYSLSRLLMNEYIYTYIHTYINSLAVWVSVNWSLVREK